MFKTLLFLLLAFTMMLEHGPARAETTLTPTAIGTTRLVPTIAEASFFRRTPRKGRPNYIKYKGGNRKKMKKLGPVRRWKLRRKAQATRGTRVSPTPSVRAGAPTRVMKK